MRKVIAGVGIVILAGCASGGGGGEGGGGAIQSSGVAFGPASAEFQPVLARSYEDAQFAVKGSPVIIGVLTPTVEQSRPVLFTPQYPRFDTDPREFEPGRHRLQARQRNAADQPRCQGNARPTLSGCRPYLQNYPGVAIPATSSLNDEYATNATLLVVTERPVDPYELSEGLIRSARSRPTLAVALRGSDTAAAQRELTAVLTELLGSSGKWAAHYQINR
jgi:hypothetical protein